APPALASGCAAGEGAAWERDKRRRVAGQAQIGDDGIEDADTDDGPGLLNEVPRAAAAGLATHSAAGAAGDAMSPPAPPPPPPSDPSQLNLAQYIIGSLTASMGTRIETIECGVATLKRTTETNARDIAAVQARLWAQEARLEALETGTWDKDEVERHLRTELAKSETLERQGITEVYGLGRFCDQAKMFFFLGNQKMRGSSQRWNGHKTPCPGARNNKLWHKVDQEPHAVELSRNASFAVRILRGYGTEHGLCTEETEMRLSDADWDKGQ
ncbi:unnamed protein product, partial [Prorocentrum cordatum]